MTNVDPYITMIKAKIEELDAELNVIKAKAKVRGAEAEIQLDEIASEYAGKRDELERKIKDLQASGGSAMQDMKEGAGRALDELAAALEKAKSRFS
ncbi:MAG TPA: hypothetical protein ENN52_02965 [Methanofollis liminatans]|uniref:Uncharacterized protein n=1 Tax=Methanofollis liminatans TaxID=2201 RepID=A0A831LVA8_9EURY|nr:hypothetical protein [Methanofollis liminatans]